MLLRVTPRRFLPFQPDSSLVALPPGVGKCLVFRNVVSSRDENMIWEELIPVLQREGQQLVAENSTPTNRIVKHTYLELFGDKEFTEVKSMQKREVRRLPGLVWSPTLMKLMKSVGPELLGGVPDMARVVEHNVPGYEMHTEHPTVGSAFLYLSLLSDTVLSFDDEGSERFGQVLLPQRSLLYCSEELRWGWRFGEHPEERHIYRGHNGLRREVSPDLRLSIQLWRFTPSLLDHRELQNRIERALSEAHRAEDVRAEREETASAAAPCHVVDFTENGDGATKPIAASPVDPLRLRVTGAMVLPAPVDQLTTVGEGILGGDLVKEQPAEVRSSAKRNIGDVEQDYVRYKTQFQNIHSVLVEMKQMQDAGQPITDTWMKKKVQDKMDDDPERQAEEGFDANNIEGVWDKVDSKARFYKSKLRGMDYDGTAFLNSTMPSISTDSPLEIKQTIRKIAPYVKDGEKILAGLPGGSRP